MSNRQSDETHVIHPKALSELGEEACIVALGVARDLRSGAIPPDHYDQSRLYTWCGTGCCIAGHMLLRKVSYDTLSRVRSDLFSPDPMFDGSDPMPFQAADAIDRYVYAGSYNAWVAA
jgi:hypothetical protein